MPNNDADPALTAAITRLIKHGRDREAAALGSEHLAPTTTGAPMDPLTQLDQVIPLLNGLVAPLDDDQLDAPTPCAAFQLRDVLGHMVGGAATFAAAFRGAPPPAAPLPDDLVAAFPAAMTDLVNAIRTPGALDRTIAAPFGEVPGETFARFVAFDGLVHAWDIAVASGQRCDPPAALVAEIDAFARQAVGDEMRDGDTFAAPHEAPDGATPIERLVAFTGRTVA